MVRKTLNLVVFICCNRAPQTGWLHNRNALFLGSGGWKLKSGSAPKTVRENCSAPHSWGLVVCWQSLVSPGPLPSFSMAFSLCARSVSHVPLLTRMPTIVIGLGPTMMISFNSGEEHV